MQGTGTYQSSDVAPFPYPREHLLAKIGIVPYLLYYEVNIC